MLSVQKEKTLNYVYSGLEDGMWVTLPVQSEKGKREHDKSHADMEKKERKRKRAERNYRIQTVMMWVVTACFIVFGVCAEINFYYYKAINVYLYTIAFSIFFFLIVVCFQIISYLKFRIVEDHSLASISNTSYLSFIVFTFFLGSTILGRLTVYLFRFGDGCCRQHSAYPDKNDVEAFTFLTSTFSVISYITLIVIGLCLNIELQKAVYIRKNK